MAELAEIYRLLNPGQFYYGDPPEKWARNILIKQIRVQMVRIRQAAHEAERIAEDFDEARAELDRGL